MAFTITRTAVQTLDVSSAPYTAFSYPQGNLWTFAEPAPPPMPYPLVLVNGDIYSNVANGSAYGFLYANGNGLYYPSTSSQSTGAYHTTSIPTPNYNGTANTAVLYRYTSTGSHLSWKTIPFGPNALGPDIGPVDGTMPAYPGVETLSPAMNPGTLLPYTVDGNVWLNDNGSGKIVAANISDSTWYNAFNLLDGDSNVLSLATNADTSGTHNTSLIEKQSGVTPVLYGVRWRQSALASAVNSVADYLQFSDPADDAAYQSAANYGSNWYYYKSNTREWFISVCDGTSSPSMFAVSNDLSTYRKITLSGVNLSTTNGGDVVYFEDIDGVSYLFDSAGYATVTSGPTTIGAAPTRRRGMFVS